MIRFEDVSVTYPGAARPVLSGVDLEVPEGELCLVVGRTGAGKSTLLRAVNGLVPHFTGGVLDGRVLVDGRDTRTHPPRELADVVGLVGQDPQAGFVTDSVEEELAYSMESLGLPNPVMRKRVEETLDLLGLADLRHRPLATLSGGQQQRVAVGAALTAHPRVLVLDEPTSALDPGAAEDVLAALHRLVHDLGMTVVIAEHRLERVAQYADRVVWLSPDGVVAGDPGPVLASAPVAPPVVRLGQVAGWDPVPVSIRDARRRAGALRSSLGAPVVPEPVVGASVVRASDVRVRYGSVEAVRGVSLEVGAGERVALMGRNGSGKSSLLWALQGTGKRSGGSVSVEGVDPAGVKPGPRRRVVGLVPQQPGDLLYLHTVGEECRQADRESS
ncbi:MAG: ATP-binding cassette domain-containing protein, partial [Saccharothrix sp.]|nr:ATP-binding cassette domain-containing protein [Saccharothrix sp.]